MFNQLLLLLKINSPVREVDSNILYKFLFDWQSLIGAFVGASLPLFFWFFTEWYKNKKLQKQNLILTEKFLVHNINNFVDNRKTVKKFIEVKLKKLINIISERTKNDVYSLDIAFFPLFSLNSPDQKIFEIIPQSDYVNNKILQAFRLSHDFEAMIKDARKQFAHTVDINREMASGKLNSPSVQNSVYADNIRGFIDFTNKELIENNMDIYLEVLVSALISVRSLRNMGTFRWRLKFSSKFRYFCNKKEQKKFDEETYDRIESFLKPQIDDQISEIEKDYKDWLLTLNQ